VCVRDDGSGFDTAKLSLHRGSLLGGGFGLFNIRERVEGLGGCFEIQSQPGQGAAATVTVPCGPRQGEVFAT
jgi:signal transduction histidine kinase